jgi:Tol biopolymer transport system component
LVLALFFLLAYRDSAGRVVYRPDGAPSKIVALKDGYEIALRPDGKQLIYTRSDEGPNRTLILWDGTTGKGRNLVSGLVREARWSPDGRQVAFLKHSGEWRVWLMPAGEPEKAKQVSALTLHSLGGWDGDALVALDGERLYWLGMDGKTRQSRPLMDIYGKQFQWMSSDHLRLHPKKPELLLVSANYMETPKGSLVDDMELNCSVFTYDLKTARRTVLLSTRMWGTDAAWSPDGEWIYFTRREKPRQNTIWRMRADGSGLERVVDGSDVAVAP